MYTEYFVTEKRSDGSMAERGPMSLAAASRRVVDLMRVHALKSYHLEIVYTHEKTNYVVSVPYTADLGPAHAP